MTTSQNEAHALRTVDLHSFYGASHVLDGVTFDAPTGAVTAILGRNGAGKTTLAHSIIGIHRATRGVVEVGGVDVSGLPAWRRARAGMQLVRQGRHIFSDLTVRENIEIAGAGNGKRLEAILEIFPSLRRRLDVAGGKLSGGEQQMLAIARALYAAPRVLLLDEPSEGLAPQVVKGLEELILLLREQGVTIVLIEQELALALAVADVVFVMGQRRMVFRGTPDELRADAGLQRQYLAV